MKYLHDRNIIHRDIKSENILLDENMKPHIKDFLIHSYNQTKLSGALAYKAPKILKTMKYDRKIDVYAFSILMFEVLTDSVHYPELLNGDMPKYDFMNKIINKGYCPKFLVSVKDSLRRLIEQCWSENPSDMPTFGEIFNKLANKNGCDEEDEEENFLLEDVDKDELNLYVENITEITDRTEKLLSKISSLKNEIKKKKLKEKDPKQSDTIKTLEEDNRQLKSEIKQVKISKKNQKLSKSKWKMRQKKVKQNQNKQKLKRKKYETSNTFFLPGE